MARNRQRAKDRKRRQAAADDGIPEVEETPVADAVPADDPEPGPEDAEEPPAGPQDADGGDDEPPVSVTKKDGDGPERSGQPGTVKRAGAFLRHSWAELQRVQWPDRQQVGQATAVVLGFVVIAGAFLGAADQAAQAIVDAII